MEFQKPDYTYRILRIVKEISPDHESPRVIDGDTVDIMIDVGFYTFVRKRVRMLEIDTDELRGGTIATKERARAAKLRLIELLDSGNLYIQTKMDSTGKYGRILGTFYVELEDGTFINVNQTLVEEGFQKGDENTSTVIEWIKKLVSK